MKRTIVLCLFLGVLGSTALTPAAHAEALATVVTGAHGLLWQPLENFSGYVLTVSKPNGEVHEETFEGTAPSYEMTTRGKYPDGVYTWQLQAIIIGRGAATDEDRGLTRKRNSPVQSGTFHVRRGVIADPEIEEPEPATHPDADAANTEARPIFHSGNGSIDGSLCIGFDCVSSESFGFDTLRLKENNLRIKFEDTSTTASFPQNDWQITANESTNGGANKFSIDDISGGRTPFTIQAGARSNALYVDSQGDVGIGTSTPAVELHAVSGDTPTLRLEQNGTSGFTPQTWDVAGNETNFFIRDATNGSRLPFRIRPGAETSSIDIAADGRVGFGGVAGGANTITLSGKDADGEPDIEVLSPDDDNADIRLARTDGASVIASASQIFGFYGTSSNHALRLRSGGTWRMQLDTTDRLDMSSGAFCTAGGVWTNASSRELKDNIEELSTAEAQEALAELNPVKYNYKADETEAHVGFIAEDVPDLVATEDRKGMSPMDVTAVLTKVVQEQQSLIQEMQARIDALEAASSN